MTWVVISLVFMIVVGLVALSMWLIWHARRRTHVSMEDIWQTWTRPEEPPDPFHSEWLAQIDEPVRESIRQNLLEFERTLKRDPDPLRTVRRELMDSVDRRLLNSEILELPPEVRARLRQQNAEMLQTDVEARTYIAANEVRMAVLREYGARRFGDRAEGDWFDVYQKASRLKQRGARNFIQRTLNGTQSQADDARYQSMTMVDQEIRTRLLNVPAGTRFPGLQAGKETVK